jgi:hypothetical protein
MLSPEHDAWYVMTDWFAKGLLSISKLHSYRHSLAGRGDPSMQSHALSAIPGDTCTKDWMLIVQDCTG